MSSWNYRVVRFPDPGGGEPSYQVCEVYYDAQGGLQSYISNSNVVGSDYNELGENLRQMNLALRLPPVDVSRFHK